MSYEFATHTILVMVLVFGPCSGAQTRLPGHIRIVLPLPRSSPPKRNLIPSIRLLLH